MKLNCIFDNREYKQKPQGQEFGAISRRLEARPGKNISVEEFKNELEKGKSYLSGSFIDRSKGRKADNIENINFFSLDVDNHYLDKNNNDVYTNYTRQDAINKVKELLGITPVIAYTTFTGINNNGSERFRLIYFIDLFCGSGEVALILKYISENSGDIFDKACKDTSRIFLATDQDITIYDDYIKLSIDKINEIKALEAKRIETTQRQRTKRTNRSTDTNYSDDIVNELKSLDISDYLISQGYGDIEKYKDGYRMPCPIHNGTNKNFYINQVNGVWLYKCFSKCSGDGGSIIDLHSELNNLNTGQAIKELLEIYNIKALEPITALSDSYTVQKYISQDKDATGAILQAIKDNRKVLVTGSMGSGKTHFITNDIYEYAKEIDKILILVIPGVKQLENLNANKGIDIVCSGAEYIKGTKRVAVTPESLLKITDTLEPDSYILAVDESHERYTSLYRTGYKNKNIEKAEVNAYKSIHLTATPRLLLNDNFDKVISIGTKTAISNNISIFKVKDKLEDNMLSVVKTLIKNDKKPILFNNNKETNELFAKEIEVKEKITIVEYESGQLDLTRPNGPKFKEIDKIIVDTETIESGKRSKNIAEGNVKADLTCTTSAVMAGIDLYTDDKAVLVINTKGLPFDNLIQLIGRFREGIEVILIVDDPEIKKEYFNLEDRISYKIRSSQELANITNNNIYIDDLMKDGLKKNAKLQRLNDKWIVNETEVIAEVYEDWSRSVFQDMDKLKELLTKQKAFKVKNIVVANFNDETESTMTELKKLSRAERKEIIEETTKIMVNLPDKELINILDKDYKGLTDEEIDTYQEYFKVANKHMIKIKHAADKLFTDGAGLMDIAAAFRHFYSNSWASIEREIEQQQAREINRLLKKHGTDFYLSKEANPFKTSIDVVQARIRHELKDLENPRGRLSNIRFNQLVNVLVQEGYIYNKYTKILKEDPDEKGREKALKCLGDIIRAKVENIYNLVDGRISSIKE